MKKKINENLYRSLFEKAGDGILIIDTEGNIKDVNRKICDWFEYTEEEFCKLNISQTHRPGSSAQKFGQKAFNQLKKDGHITLESEFITKSGKLLNGEVSSIVVKEADEKRIYSIFRDTTKRRLAEEKLLRSEEQYRGVVEDIPILICCFLPNTEITFANKNYCRYFDKEHDELIGSSFLSLIPELQKESVLRNISSLTKESPTMSHEHEVIAHGGELRWQRWTNRALFDSKNTLIGYQSIGEDITERKKVRTALKESEQKYRELFENSNDGIIIHDLNGAILNANQKILKLLDYSDSEIKTLTISDLHPQTELDKSKEAFRTIISEGFVSFEIDFMKKSGKTFPAEVSSNISEIGETKVISGIVRDITERKKAEEAIKDSEEQLNAFFTNSPVGLGIWDTEFRYVAINDTLQKINGLSVKDHIGKTIEEVLPKAAPVILPLFKKIFSTCEPLLNMELSGEVPSSPGVITHYLVSYFPLSIVNGTPHLIGGIILNITEQKQIEEELEKHRKHLEKLVNERTTQLEEKNIHLQRINDAMVDREFRIKELRDKIETLEKNKNSNK